MAVAAILAAFAVVGALMVGAGRAMVYDEAVYAARARELVTDLPATRFIHTFRPPGLPTIGVVGALGGWSDEAMRAITLALAVMAMAAAWLLARIVFGAATALLALGVSVGTPAVLAWTPTFLNDLGSAALTIVGMALLWVEFERRPMPGRRLMLVAVVFAAAYYVRFGAVIFIAAIGVTSFVLWWDAIRRSKRLVLAAGALGLVLLVPHFVAATLITGLPVGILAYARHASRPVPLAESAGAYIEWLIDGRLVGSVGLVVLVAALGAGGAVVLAYLRARSWTPFMRGVAWVGLPALGVLIPLLTTHAEVRYAIFPLLLGILLGAAAIVHAVHWALLGVRLRSVRVAAVLLVGVLVVRGSVAAAQYEVGLVQRAAVVQAWRKEMGALLARDSGGRCLTASAYNAAATLNWYGGCFAVLADSIEPRARPWSSAGLVGYLVVTPADERNLPPSLIEEYRSLAPGQPLAVYRDRRGDTVAEVYRLP